MREYQPRPARPERLPGAKREMRDGGFQALRGHFGAHSEETLLEAARRASSGEQVPALVRYAAAVFVLAHDDQDHLVRIGQTQGQDVAAAALSLMNLLSIMLWESPPTNHLILRSIALYLICLCDEPSFPAPCPGCVWQLQYR